MKMYKKLLILMLLLILACDPICYAQEQGTWYVFTQLKYPGNWDPYPDVFGHIYYYLSNTTSLRIRPERRVVTLDDEILYYSPFILFTGTGMYPAFSEQQILNLRRYIEGGGILLIDTAGNRDFSDCADRTIERVFPRQKYRKIPEDHAIFRAFYLVDYVSGRVINAPYLEGIYMNNKYVVIKCQNDLPGVWPRDSFGNWESDLIPGRFSQRKEAIKLTLNILMYSVCGTYKNDPVHLPDIKRKLGR
ncbi:DUF4159 domain-containing protein [Elusimicrobiota bacterium]